MIRNSLSELHTASLKPNPGKGLQLCDKIIMTEPAFVILAVDQLCCENICPDRSKAGGNQMNDEKQIRDTIKTYFDSMYESSSDKVHAAFHPKAKITGYLEDGLHEMLVGDFAGFVES